MLTGQVSGSIVDAAAKAEALLQLAREHGIPAAQTVAVGDGADDLKMMGVAGLGIAIHAKPLVRAQAAATLNHHDSGRGALPARCARLPRQALELKPAQGGAENKMELLQQSLFVPVANIGSMCAISSPVSPSMPIPS